MTPAGGPTLKRSRPDGPTMGFVAGVFAVLFSRRSFTSRKVCVPNPHIAYI